MVNTHFKILNFLILLLITLNIYAQDTTKCYPPCRTGFTCYKGECVSICNPPCPSGQKCTEEGECIQIDEETSVHSKNRSSQVTKQIKRDIPCNNIFIVRPDLKPEVVPGDFEKGELLSAGNMIANAIMAKISSSSKIIASNELEFIQKCNSKLIVARVKSYHKEPARMGQYEGVVTIVIEVYNSVQQSKPTSIEEFSAKGKRHWGDSVPLENSFQSVSKIIKRDFKP